MITPAQCRGARAMLQIKQQDLADQAGVTRRTLALFEAETRAPRERTLDRIRKVLEAAGAKFIETEDGEGVIRRRTTQLHEPS
jgi:transcriptional regulator with XRE-family HTH domain